MALDPHMQIRGSRDLTVIERVITHPQWVMPPGVHEWLPGMLAEIIGKRRVDKDGKEVGYAFSTRARTKAMAQLARMHDSNIRSAPPAQTVNVNVDPSTEAAIARAQAMTPEQRRAVQAARDVIVGLTQGSSPGN